jgi:anti-anti-sigma factor
MRNSVPFFGGLFGGVLILSRVMIRDNRSEMASESLQIVASQSSRGQKILSLKGPLSIRTVFQFQDALRSESSPVLIVDFSEVPFIDSAGLGALVAAHVSGSKSNRKVVFAAFNNQARTLIEMTHVNHLFPTYDTIQDAEEAVRLSR